MIISLFPIFLLSAVGCKRVIEFPIFFAGVPLGRK